MELDLLVFFFLPHLQERKKAALKKKNIQALESKTIFISNPFIDLICKSISVSTTSKV